ncbi:Pre-mRNA-splicing factor 38 [Spathaspora sp. JA1]|nr:Pre-mRNA-splicing factor 38 [Spathaspora sp. JA1]
MSSKEDATHHKKQAAYQDKRNILNKGYLIEPIIRHRIQDSIFYKQYLYLSNEATLLPIITEHVQYISGMDSSGRPSPFICCLLRMLELEPSSDMIDTYLTQLGFNEFKYLTALTLIYIRLVYSSEIIYEKFDRYFQDFRKLRIKLKSPIFNEVKLPITYGLTYFDEWVDDLLTKERVIDIILPRLMPRIKFVENGVLPPRQYHIDMTEENQDPDSNVSEEDSYHSDSD